MFVSLARQYRRVLFSRIPKPQYFTTVCITGTYIRGLPIPGNECEVYAGTWQWPLGKVNIDNDCIDDNATLSIGLDEEDVRVDMWLDVHASEDEDHWLDSLDLSVELNDNNVEKRLSEFFHRVRSLKMIDGKEYFDISTDVQYPWKLSTFAHTKLVSLELEIQQLIQKWNLRQVAVKRISTQHGISSGTIMNYHETGSYSAWEAIEAEWDVDSRNEDIMKRYGISEKEGIDEWINWLEEEHEEDDEEEE